ncbi:MAG: hypothetical protein RMK02_10560 [Burkholderiales bacterium]|nr:hypothetical protein [Burkholderiales bacterium]
MLDGTHKPPCTAYFDEYVAIVLRITRQTGLQFRNHLIARSKRPVAETEVKQQPELKARLATNDLDGFIRASFFRQSNGSVEILLLGIDNDERSIEVLTLQPIDGTLYYRYRICLCGSGNDLDARRVDAKVFSQSLQVIWLRFRAFTHDEYRLGSLSSRVLPFETRAFSRDSTVLGMTFAHAART